MLHILTHLHDYYPYPCSGADIMAERINTFLASRGCEVMVAVDNCSNDFTYKNHTVTSNKRLLGEKYEWADVIITHFLFKGACSSIAARFNKPIFHVMHSFIGTELRADTPDNYLIYNSHHLKAEIEPIYPMEGIVCQPPTFPEDWQSDIDHFTKAYITQVNVTGNKGAEMLWQLASSLQMKFMGVHGGYGSQMSRQSGANNLSYRHFTHDIKDIYNQTKIILVPSISESWSFVAAEANASGIPVVCSDLPGLRENCGDAAIYCKNKRQFMEALISLHDPNVYYDYVARGLRRAAEKNHLTQLENMLNFMRQKVVNITEMQPEKLFIDIPKEKKEMKPVKEKKEISRPTTKKKVK